MAPRLVSHYEILEKLGEGGMGVVYRALDLRLGRPVALKFLSSHLLASEDARNRFFQEARAIAALNHPHIATLYEADAEEETPFLALEYLPGGTLRSRLRDLHAAGLALSCAELIAYALQVAAALAYAHRHGIIHRDVKSENVMFTEAGDLKITDFGLARYQGAPTHTRGGGVAGTIAYMAPERLQGLEADARADVFSFGVVLYEAATGELPFQGEHQAAVLHQVIHTPTPAVTRLRPDLPAAFERIVDRATAKDRDQRYQSIEELADDLRALRDGREREASAQLGRTPSAQTMSLPPTAGPRPVTRRRLWRAALLVVLLCLAVVGGALLRDRLREILKPEQRPAVHRLAVLPFTNVGDDPANQAFCDGLMETLTNRLTQLEQFQGALRVVPATEVRDGEIASTSAARRAFGATLVLGGSVERLGKRVRLMVNLVDALSLEQLRSKQIATQVGDLWALQDGVVDLVTELLELELRPAARDMLRAGETRSGAAYDLFVQGHGYLARWDKGENVEKAISLFQQALREDPKYALAHAGLGEALWRRYWHTKEPSWIKEAQKSCSRALELNDRLAALYVTRGIILAGTGSPEEAVKDLERALKLDPSNATAYRALGDAYRGLGDYGAAERILRKAIDLRSNDWAAYKDLGMFYYRRGNYPAAEPCFRRMTELNPDDYLGYRQLGGTYYLMGRYDEAIALHKKSLAIRPTEVAFSNLGTIYFFQDRYAEAAQAFEEAVKQGTVKYLIWGNLADAYLRTTGPTEKSAHAYRRAVQLAERDLTVNAKDSETRASLAVYCARLGQKERAESAAGEARRLAPGNVTVLFRSGLAYELAGKRDLAIAALRDALAGGYSAAEIQRHPDLAGLRQDPRFSAPPPPAGAPGSGQKTK